MAEYRKKPVVIEAYQTDKEMIIHTLEGDMKADIGDYIITGVQGEQYPCKPDIFEQTYKKVDKDTDEPTIDIVTCGKCKHFRKGEVCELYHVNKGKADFFCADGERR
jgi:hypothetical protein